MRTIQLYLTAGLFALAEGPSLSAPLLVKSPVQCLIKNVVVNNHHSVLGTNPVFFLSVTIELANHETNTFEIDRDSLVVALNTVRLSDTNGVAWKINSPLNRYNYDPLDRGERTFLLLPGNTTNRFEVMLTSLDAPFVPINNKFFRGNQLNKMPSQMGGSIFTGVLGRVDGDQRMGKMLLQGASNFSIVTQNDATNARKAHRR